MKNLGTRSSILVGLCGAALMITSIGCGSSSTPGTDASGNGGTSAGGSSGGGGTGGAAPALSYTFGSSVQDWSINVYHDTGLSTNIGWELSPDAGMDAAMPPLLTWDSTDGDPAATAAGCLKLTTTFTGYNQYVDIKVGVSGTAQNLKGRTLTAKVQLASATGGTFPGGAILEADTTPTYSYGGSLGVQLMPPNTWKTLQLALDTVMPLTGQTYDDTMVIQVGVQFYMGSTPTDGGTTPGPIDATFLIDTVEAH
jgi:hypothetical protein